jgi:hypothetical protein
MGWARPASGSGMPWWAATSWPNTRDCCWSRRVGSRTASTGLAALVDADGLLVEGRSHPALVESRAQQITLARLLAALRVPDDDTGQPPQRRSVRGVYRLRSVR